MDGWMDGWIDRWMDGWARTTTTQVIPRSLAFAADKNRDEPCFDFLAGSPPDPFSSFLWTLTFVGTNLKKICLE